MYGKAFEIKFKSHKGDWRIELSQKDYTGVVTQLSAGGDPANFTLNNQGDEKHKPLKSFMAQLQVEVAVHGQLASLFGSDAQKTRCRAYLNNNLYFNGYITPDDYSEPLHHPPYNLELQAICGLGLLQGIDFLQTDGSWYMGRMDKLTVIRLILEKIDSHKLPMYIASGMYEKRMDRNRNALSQQYVNVETYVSSDGDPLSCHDVLNDLLLGYRLLQQDGAWHATQLNLLDGTPYLADHYEISVGQFTRQGSILVNPKVEFFDKTKLKYNGYVRGSQLERYIEGAKKLTSKQDYQLIRNLFKSGDFQNSDWEPYYTNNRRIHWRLISKFPDNKVEYVKDAVYASYIVSDERIPAITSYGGELKDSFPIKAMTAGVNVLKVQFFLAAINYYTSKYPTALQATNGLGTTADVDVMIKLGNYYLTKDGWEQSDEPVRVTQEITSGAAESKFDLSFIAPTIPIEGDLEISIFGKTEKAIVVHDVRVFFIKEDLEVAGSQELVGVQNPLKANELSDISLLTGDVPELSNFDSVWRGGLTLAGNLQTKDWQALGHDSEYDYAELISRIVLSGYSCDIHTLSATIEADINAISIIYDKYTGRYYAANGITYNVSEDEWSGEWIEVFPYTYAGANFNASQISNSREGNYTKTSQTNDFAVYGNGELGTGKRVYELPAASDLTGAKLMLDKAGWPEAKCTDLSIFARKYVDNHFAGQTIEGPLVVNGPITQNGESYITHAQHVEVENNLMQLNLGESAAQITGLIPGTSTAFSGIEINRGSSEAYYFGIVEGTKPLFKLGKKNNLVTLAAREDSPMNNGVMLWDDANHRMKAVTAAPDSDKLGGIAATNYARTDIKETFNKIVKFKESIQNDSFTDGILTGSGYRITPEGIMQADSLELRKSLTVPELIISKERSINGGLVTSVANGEVKSVDGDVVTLKGEHNSFIIGDRVRLQDWNAGSRYMEAEVTAVNDLTITLGNYNTATRPKDGDSLVQWGHKTDATRQSFLYQTSRGGGFFAVYNGVNSASLANKEVVRMGNLSNDNVGLISEYGGKRFFELSNNRKEIAGCKFDETHIWTTGWAMHHNGNFSLGKGQINYDIMTNKVSFGEGVTLNWSNLSDDTKVNLKGADGDDGYIGRDGTDGGKVYSSNSNWIKSMSYPTYSYLYVSSITPSISSSMNIPNGSLIVSSNSISGVSECKSSHTTYVYVLTSSLIDSTGAKGATGATGAKGEDGKGDKTTKNIDLRNFDVNKYYPITIACTPYKKYTIRVNRSLDKAYGVPSYSTHASGFSCMYEWTTIGSGSGTIDVQREILTSNAKFTNGYVAGSIGQLTSSSQEYIHLRGGSIYTINVYGATSVPITLRDTPYSIYSQSLKPETSVYPIKVTKSSEWVTKITNDTIETTNVIAKNLSVEAANVRGTLTANQIDVNTLKAKIITSSNINAANVNFTKGKIGGFTIGLNSLSSVGGIISNLYEDSGKNYGLSFVAKSGSLLIQSDDSVVCRCDKWEFFGREGTGFYGRIDSLGALFGDVTVSKRLYVQDKAIFRNDIQCIGVLEVNKSIKANVVLGGGISNPSWTSSSSGTQLSITSTAGSTKMANKYGFTSTAGSKLYVKLPTLYSTPDGTSIEITTAGLDIRIVHTSSSRLNWGDGGVENTNEHYDFGGEVQTVKWTKYSNAWYLVKNENE